MQLSVQNRLLLFELGPQIPLTTDFCDPFVKPLLILTSPQSMSPVFQRLALAVELFEGKSLLDQVARQGFRRLAHRPELTALRCHCRFS